MSKPEKNWLEWWVFTASSLLVLAVVGYVVQATFSGAPQRPPALEVQLGQPRRVYHQFAVPVTVYNHGDQTAQAVVVQVLLTDRHGQQEQAEFEIQFLPPQSARRGEVTFATDPSGAEAIHGRARGYEVP